MRCAVRAGREGLDGLRVAKRRKLPFFGPQIGYLPMLEHHSPYSDAVSWEQEVRRAGYAHRWTAFSGSHTKVPVGRISVYPICTPPKTRKLTHALLFYFSDDSRHQQSVQMEIPKQGFNIA